MADEKTGKERTGKSNYCDITVLGQKGTVAVVRLKGKDEDEVKGKVAKLAIGKPAEIEITGMGETVRGVQVLNA